MEQSREGSRFAGHTPDPWPPLWLPSPTVAIRTQCHSLPVIYGIEGELFSITPYIYSWPNCRSFQVSSEFESRATCGIRDRGRESIYPELPLKYNIFGQRITWEIFKIVSVNHKWNFCISTKYLCSEEAKMWIFCQSQRQRMCQARLLVIHVLFKLLYFLLLSFT